ncbi:MAG TPA: DUF1206 domain-containing protein [Gemmatimonadales bacterium]|nr:DUF1206 domain-containing protein [Gemmatimonadales bacterium]
MALPPRSLERIARVGIVARALVYVAIGLLATAAAFRLGGAITDTSGVYYFVLHQPLGRVLLAALALGLGAYTIWLLAQVFLDPYGNGTSLIGLVNRFGQLLTGVAQLAVAVEGGRLALGLPSVFSGGPTIRDADEQLVAEGLQVPFGVQLVGLVGIILLIVAVIQMYRGLLGDVRRDWRLDGLGGNGHWAIHVGRFGLAARAIVLGVSGALVVQAARAYDPSRAGGIREVLRILGRQYSSGWLLGLVALGLVAFGIFGLVEARYRTIPTDRGPMGGAGSTGRG